MVGREWGNLGGVGGTGEAGWSGGEGSSLFRRVDGELVVK